MFNKVNFCTKTAKGECIQQVSQLRVHKLQAQGWGSTYVGNVRKGKSGTGHDDNKVSSSLNEGVQEVEDSFKPWQTPWAELLNSVLPTALVPYAHLARLHKPAPALLVAIPASWAICLATPVGALPSTYLMMLFVIAALAMRGAGCTINDMWDKNLDKKVARTKVRPLAAGLITRFQALLFAIPQLTIGIMISLQFNTYGFWIAVSSILLMSIYPYFKRITNMPQLMLGLTMSYSAFIGWSAVAAKLEPPVIPLYIAGVFWTLFYDTIYAHMDKKDDVATGIKSSALLFGENSAQVLTGFASMTVLNLTIAGSMCNVGFIYYVGLAYAAYHLYSQLKNVDYDDRQSCQRIFDSNIWLGVAFTLFAFVDRCILYNGYLKTPGLIGLGLIGF